MSILTVTTINTSTAIPASIPNLVITTGNASSGVINIQSTGTLITITGTLIGSTGTLLHGNSQITGTCQITSLGVGTGASGTTGEIRANNDITAYYTSDETLKQNVIPIKNALDKLKLINGVEFDWTDEYINERGGEDGYFVRRHDVGVIAQEIEKILPEVVATKQNGIKAVKYDRIVALLIEAVKELAEKIEEK
jgi:hypothetical protein